MNPTIVCHLGARGHYSVANAVERYGCLLRLFTDACSARGLPKLIKVVPKCFQPNVVKRLLGRAPDGIPPTKIDCATLLGIQYGYALYKTISETERLKLYHDFGRKFATRVASNIPESTRTIYAMNTECLELFRVAKSRGIRLVLEQTMASAAVTQSTLAAHSLLYPDWAIKLGDYQASGIIDREQKEWELADRIVCGSEYVADSIKSAGGPIEKCVVVPYGVRSESFVPVSLRNQEYMQDERLRVLTVGSLCFRKGTHLILEAASKLVGQATFRLVGPGVLPTSAIDMLSANVELTGQCPRTEILKHFEWADVFLLPSLCEGSAMVTYEALLMGLPVICTPNTGSIITDQKDGFLVTTGCVESIVDRIQYLRDNPAVLNSMSAAALARRSFVDTSSYDNRIISAIYG